MIGGVDEAGRGCLLGPLVVAGVSVSKGGVKKLKELGVKDSKKLSAKQRDSLYPEIMKVANKVTWASIAPEEIDAVVFRGKKLRKLNYLEALYFAKVIDRLGAEKVTVDASDVLPKRFGKDIAGNLEARCRVLAFHKADRDFPVVSAASIIAKVERDRQVELLRGSHGDFGSGYPSDPVTRSFFSDWMRRGEPLPGYVRKSWKTWVKLEQSLTGA
ncbi:MAG: ribonuclease HII [Thaumarchaeota archaeon]|nr:ribonuclease HII [Nitrososphaerota archaeon]